MTETLADLRLLDAHMRTTYARKERVSAYVLRLARTFGFRSEDFLASAVDVVLAAQIEQALATWELHSTAATLADPLGRTLDVDPPVEVMVGAATHDGTPLETVYRRPGSLLAELAAEGVAAGVAQARAERMAVELVDVDMMVAGRNAEEVHGRVDLRVVGTRRVPNATACKWCRYIATQRYKKERLAPAHAHCNCGTREIYGKRDPGQILAPKELQRIKREGVPKKYGSGDARKANRKLDVGAPLPPTATLDAPAPKMPKPKPPVDTRPPADYSKAKTTDEIVDLWNARHEGGTKFTPGGWDAKTTRVVAEALDDVVERFPLADDLPLDEVGNLRDVFPKKKIRRGVQGLAQSNPVEWDRELGDWVARPTTGPYGTRARIGVSTGSVKSAKMSEEMKAAGWWSTDHQAATVVHEYGHQVGYSAELTLLRRNLDDYAVRARAVAPNVRISGNRDAGDLWNREMAELLSKTYGDGGPVSWSDLVPTITKELSEYGATNGRELVAEAFTEYALLGDEARPLAKLVTEHALALIEEGKALK